jgi:lysozyme
MTVSKDCIDIIKTFEGLKLAPYVCPAGKLTIGYGHTKTVKPGQAPITKEEAEDLLYEDVDHFSKGVAKLLTAQVNQNQFDALVSLAYNIGLGAFERSTLLRMLNRGDVAGASTQFLRWRNPGSHFEAGLLRRRKAERALFDKKEE